MNPKDIETNKNTNTLDSESIDKFTKQFIRKTKGMSKKDIAFTVWEFGHHRWAEGREYQKNLTWK